MVKGKKYPKGCSDLGRLYDHLSKEEKAKRRVDYLNSRKEEVKEAKEQEPKK